MFSTNGSTARPNTPRVCVSQPTVGNVRIESERSLLRMFVEMYPNIETTPLAPKDMGCLDAVRNEEVIYFLERTECTHLFHLDADCVTPPNVLKRLLAHDLPIIAAPHLALTDGHVGLMVAGEGFESKALTGLVEAEKVGCGGLLIRRDVFEKIEPPWFLYEKDERGCRKGGEDFYFCKKARAAGYKIYADCDLWQDHIKPMRLSILSRMQNAVRAE